LTSKDDLLSANTSLEESLLRRVLLCIVVAAIFLASPTQVQAGPSLHYGPPYISTGGFLRPFGIALDETHGRLLVADTGNHRFKWTTISDLAGPHVYTEHGYVIDRAAANALNSPQAIAVDSAGNVYVVNPLSGTVKLFTWNGGDYSNAQTFCNLTVDNIDILMPRDIAVGPDDAVYLLDSGNNRILKADGPNDSTWSVFHSDPTWKNPYGLTVDRSGIVFVADTGNHRIAKIDTAAVVTTFGRWGTGSGEFRFPRDLAVDQHGRIYVADTFNHRIVVLASDGHFLVQLGEAPAVNTINKIVVDSSDRVLTVDSDNNHVIAYLGAGVPAKFDAFVRDHLGDPGSEPSDDAYPVSSPDILVRHSPDVDLASAAIAGLETIEFQQPIYNENNYVYVALHNRGTQVAENNFVRVYWIDPGTPDVFPDNWHSSGFYYAYTDDTQNAPGNTLPVSRVAAGGTVVVGPLVWRPPPPDSAVCRSGVFRVGVRAVNPYDYPPTGNSVTLARDANNITERMLTAPPVEFEARVPFSSSGGTTAVNVATILDRQAEFFRQEAGKSIVIGGYATGTQTPEYLLAFSQRIAQSVSNALVARGVAPSRITVRGYGRAGFECCNALDFPIVDACTLTVAED
jgi:sugar lactone lactonase YvrE